jgi:hypothetical protein
MRSLRRPNWRAVGIPPKQPDGPNWVKGQEAEALDRGTAISEPMPSFSESEMGRFPITVDNLQTGFAPEARIRRQAGDRADAEARRKISPTSGRGLEKQSGCR